jgi:para-aminobenzoate synthetase component I
MRKKLDIRIANIEEFKKKLLIAGEKYKRFILLDSNNYPQKETSVYTYYEYDFLAGIGSVKEINNKSFKSLSAFNKQNKDWLFGYFTYDLKNELEDLESSKPEELHFPELHFFIPEIVITCKKENVSVFYFDNQYSENEINKYISSILDIEIPDYKEEHKPVKLAQKFSEKEYIETVNKLKHHIQIGDIYEINFCQEFFSNSKIEPVRTYLRLKDISPAPFSCFYKIDDKFLLSASPERFLKKEKNKIISQPIKGTIRRSTNKNEDNQLKDKLLNDPKEKAENVMIVDLVRNDLSKTAKKGSVKVEELFGIYSFTQVHQMISTVSSEIEGNTDIIEVIKNAFPMGSMTGAPKIRAMKLIEKYERSKRELYSGAVGYISPEKNFDFNVVIRSILYNDDKNYVSFTVGGAITNLAIAESEYDECMIKAKAMIEVLN